MKSFTSMLMYFTRRRVNQRNSLILFRFFVILTLLITSYSMGFHFLMEREGQTFTWITGFYWTLTVMSTLGFGDITFHTDLGRIFSMLVLLTGMVFMLTLLPFTFIQFFYAPWMEAQSASRTRRDLPPDTRGHVLMISDDEITRTLIRRLERYHYPYVMLAPNVQAALALQDEGIHAVVGDLDDPETYARTRLAQAALMTATSSDVVNTGAVSVARGLSETIPIVSTAKDAHSVDILQLAGSTRVLRLGEMMGKALARRLIAGDAMSHIVGAFDSLHVAEATAANTPLVGKTLEESRLDELVGARVAGLWERGVFHPPTPDAKITQHSMLVLIGTRSQLEEYDELLCIYNSSSAPAVIIGGGRVGRALGRALDRRRVKYRIIEKLPERLLEDDRYVEGSAANLDVLKQAGFMESPAVAITTHDDDLNVYLTIYCRKLRPDIQIITRATKERIVGTLHRAGADSVLSYASMGANTLFNVLQFSDVVMVAEGLNIFRIKVPSSLAGHTLEEVDLYRQTGCMVIAIQHEGKSVLRPDRSSILPSGASILIIGNVASEEAFMKRYAAR